MKVLFINLILFFSIFNSFTLSSSRNKVEERLLALHETNFECAGEIFSFRRDTININIDQLKFGTPARLVYSCPASYVLTFEHMDGTSEEIDYILFSNKNPGGCFEIIDNNKKNWCLVDNLNSNGVLKYYNKNEKYLLIFKSTMLFSK